MKWWLGILTGIVAIMFVVILAAYFNGVPYSHNTATLLISVLGVIVTALVGWQVFNAIENVRTLKKMGELEDKINIQINLSERRNQELFDIAEAHRLEWEADRSTDEIYQYSCHLRALLLYIKSDVSLDYPPVRNKIGYLTMLINQVRRSKDDDDRIRFANEMAAFDETHEDLLDAIATREDNLRRFRRQVIDLRHQRKNLFDQFVGQETSIQREQRESEEKAKEEQDKQAAESKADTP